MNGNTVATLHELFTASWFTRVGYADTPSARVLQNWEDAIASCTSRAWEDLRLEAVNRYRERIAERSRERLRLWNQTVDDVEPTVRELVHVKTSPLVMGEGLPARFVEVVEWDMLHVCLESEFADVFPPGFYAAQAYWYTVGHFPCGWDGNFPDGTRIVY